MGNHGFSSTVEITVVSWSGNLEGNGIVCVVRRRSDGILCDFLIHGNGKLQMFHKWNPDHLNYYSYSHELFYSTE